MGKLTILEKIKLSIERKRLGQEFNNARIKALSNAGYSVSDIATKMKLKESIVRIIIKNEESK